MTRDKQLLNVALDQVLEKRRLDQALSAKEFAVLAGISYSTARMWFRQPSFPAFCGVVFWQDFVEWRSRKTGLRKLDLQHLQVCDCPAVESPPPTTMSPVSRFTGRAAHILAEAEKRGL